MKRFTCIAALCLSLGMSSLQAQEQPSAKVMELLEVLRTEQAMLDGFNAMMPAIDTQAQHWQLSPEQLEAFRELHREWFVNDLDLDAMIQAIALEYDNTYSKAEMQDMIDFYLSPTGQKTLQEEPRLMQYGAQMGMLEGQKKEYLLKQKIRAFYQANVATEK
ncbi:hypothetical protein MAQ5080_01490 [Marinomonas aquimarina]|uniref:DUF2059 domain-containing protein n=1 Tax=Marinomonas aquimarina TaxID=295068 RepID=A0A1A8TCV1_9GAMM|nr:DUF2059 domain-containing protein [Marinomonas aquimarina]SBS29748.1 hypothetical protein MAQ5080_01490 [Marinomonas aquimarina]